MRAGPRNGTGLAQAPVGVDSETDENYVRESSMDLFGHLVPVVHYEVCIETEPTGIRPAK